MEAYYQQFSNWLTLRNYAARTKKSYGCSLRQLWTYCEKQTENPTFSNGQKFGRKMAIVADFIGEKNI